MLLRRNLFKMEPRGLNPPHKRRNEALWNAVFDLRNYFTQVSQRPHMGLLARLLDQNEDTFNGEWRKRKHWFKDEKGSERLQRLELFIGTIVKEFAKLSGQGIPLYAKWESKPSRVSDHKQWWFQ